MQPVLLQPKDSQMVAQEIIRHIIRPDPYSDKNLSQLLIRAFEDSLQKVLNEAIKTHAKTF